MVRQRAGFATASPVMPTDMSPMMLIVMSFMMHLPDVEPTPHTSTQDDPNP